MFIFPVACLSQGILYASRNTLFTNSEEKCGLSWSLMWLFLPQARIKSFEVCFCGRLYFLYMVVLLLSTYAAHWASYLWYRWASMCFIVVFAAHWASFFQHGFIGCNCLILQRISGFLGRHETCTSANKPMLPEVSRSSIFSLKFVFEAGFFPISNLKEIHRESCFHPSASK